MIECDVLMLLDNPLISDQRVEKEARSLTQAGMKVIVLALSESDRPAREETRDGYLIRRVLDPMLLRPLNRGYPQALTNAVREINNVQFPILHCHDYMLLELASRIKRQKPDIFLTYDIHEYLRGWPYYREASSLVNRLKGRLVWQSLLRKEAQMIGWCDFVVSTSPETSKRLQANYNLKKRPIHVLNIPDFALEEPIDLRTLLDISQSQTIIIHSGNIYHSEKQLGGLLSIVLNRDDITLIFLGNRPRHYELQARVKNEPRMAERVKFIEYQKFAINRVIQGADIGLVHTRSSMYLNHRIGSSNRVMEYLKCGLPVISAEHMLHRALDQKEHFAEFYDENDTKSLEGALNRMLSNLKERSAAALRLRPSLSWEDGFNPVIDQYRSWLGSRQ